MRKYVPFIVVFVIFVILFTCMLMNKNQDSSLAVIYTNYNIELQNSSFINIKMYVNSKNSFLTNKNQIVSSRIIDEEQNNVINLELERIIDTKGVLNYEKGFNEYVYSFKILFDIEDDFYMEIDNALLELTFSNYKKRLIRIGDLSMVKQTNIDDCLSITKVKPLICFNGSSNVLGGIIYKVRNNNTTQVSLKNISPLNINVSIGSGVKVLSHDDYQSFSDIVGYDYIEETKNTSDFTINLNHQEEKYIFVPLIYDKATMINSFPILIEYEMEGKIYDYYYGKYLYYELGNSTITSSDINVYDFK